MVEIGLAADTVGAGDPGLDKNVEELNGRVRRGAFGVVKES